MNTHIKNILILYFSFVFSILFLFGIMFYFIPVKAAEPCDPNMKKIKETFQDLRAIAAHPEVMYIHLHKDELKNIKEKAKFDSSLEIFIKMN